MKEAGQAKPNRRVGKPPRERLPRREAPRAQPADDGPETPETLDQLIAAAESLGSPIRQRGHAARLARTARVLARQTDRQQAAVIPLLLAREAYAARRWAAGRAAEAQASADQSRRESLDSKFGRDFGALGGSRIADLHLVDELKVQKNRTTQARPADFQLGEAHPVRSLPTGHVLPYCWNLDQRELWLTLHLRPETVLAEPFLYTAQRHQARVVARVPFDRLDEVFGAHDPAVAPVFIYSVGRTGSTLMDSLMRCVTPRAVSEPDTLSQLAVSKRVLRESDDEDTRRLLWHSISPFFRTEVGGAGPSRLSVKFRSQVNLLDERLTAVFPNARNVFMLRRREPWARSTLRAFGIPPERAVGRLVQGVRTLSHLQQSGADLALIWYEDLLADPKAVVGRILGEAPSAEAEARLAAVMAVDSQAGTRVSRDRANRKRGDGEAEWMAAFEAAWARVKPRAALERLGVDL
jgi:hypothetical protein